MKKVAIVVPNGLSALSSLVLTAEIIERANEYYVGIGKEAVMKTILAGDSKSKKFKKSPFTILLDKHIEEVKDVDLIIIPSLGDDLEMAMKRNKKIIDWIIALYKNGAEVASLCTGAFMLAAAGLLDGKQCSTHWSAAETFRKMFPGVDLQ